MNRVLAIVLLAVSALTAGAQEFNQIPRAWKWIGNEEVIFTYDGTYEDDASFVFNARKVKRTEGIKAPAKFSDFPLRPEGAVNLTYSPDSTKLAFTRDNDLYVVDIASGKETRLTHDGTDVILNGYASWVYYEEILGRPSRYRAFWWSPDSRKIGFYRFDNSEVPMFPIYSAYPNPQAAASQSQSPKVTDLGLGGSLSETRYPKAGQTNPQVRIGIIDLGACEGCPLSGSGECGSPEIVWADFDPTLDQYFGIPFWGPDSKEFFIARMPRLQNTIDLYAVNIADGSKRHVYNETYKTWLNWFDGVVFTDKGLYMSREFETGWQQIYFLSYDGKEFRRLTDGTNWSVAIQRVDEKKGEVYFTAKRDATVRQALYKVDSKGVIKALTDPAYNVTGVRFSPDGKYFSAAYSNVTTPTRVAVFTTSGGVVSEGHNEDIEPANLRKPAVPAKKQKGYDLAGYVVADMQGPDYDASKYALGQLVHMQTRDGFTLPGMIVYPKSFDPAKQYPVHVDIYGGPDSPQVNDRWITPNSSNQWYSDNEIIQITVDPRAEGHNGREGLDMIYRQLSVVEFEDFCDWADWLMEKPYVRDEKIGIEGFSYGGMMTALILFRASDKFHYGIAGAGVYDWLLYDTHYTERYMDTPQANPDGYKAGSIINYVSEYPVEYGTPEGVEPVMLKLTHGTGDDNVHLQNSLWLINELHRHGKKFEFMIYPDGMHGYRGYQGQHFQNDNREFWLKYLKSE
ncbi:MAG: DPP IV N-terminal domain-containing protein [Bacteroidales bacterium]|nr:DPP IV N-terminal domain-containing protein [Bacteroidales bacterium]